MKAKCPHCGHDVFLSVEYLHPDNNPSSSYGTNVMVAFGTYEKITSSYWRCPNCDHIVAYNIIEEKGKKPFAKLMWPVAAVRTVPSEVPSHIAKQYREAAEVLPMSEEASAALSRRCLQTVLTEAGKSTKRDLVDQITEMLPTLSSELQTQLDAVRNIGNFGAHPLKSTTTGAIVEVEAGEAEWNLDVLDLLFDHYYVKPAQIAAKRQALNAKLKQLGKPPMK